MAIAPLYHKIQIKGEKLEIPIVRATNLHEYFEAPIVSFVGSPDSIRDLQSKLLNQQQSNNINSNTMANSLFLETNTTTLFQQVSIGSQHAVFAQFHGFDSIIFSEVANNNNNDFDSHSFSSILKRNDFISEKDLDNILRLFNNNNQLNEDGDLLENLKSFERIQLDCLISMSDIVIFVDDDSQEAFNFNSYEHSDLLKCWLKTKAFANQIQKEMRSVTNFFPPNMRETIEEIQGVDPEESQKGKFIEHLKSSIQRWSNKLFVFFRNESKVI